MIDTETLEHLAHLARIAIKDEEKEQLQQDINNMVGFIDTIQKVSLSEQGKGEVVQKNVSREDTVAPLESVYNLVEAAPMHKDGFVQVPKIIGGGSQ
jgi:aspartyl-tRNA(Asn)/glutamyl-tRNA(Gln) amidotransferase subunit C